MTSSCWSRRRRSTWSRSTSARGAPRSRSSTNSAARASPSARSRRPGRAVRHGRRTCSTLQARSASASSGEPYPRRPARGRVPRRRSRSTDTEDQRDQRGRRFARTSRIVAPRWTGLLCGDVGFGKTELAMRSRVSRWRSPGDRSRVLVPTTVLADQHGRDLSRRRFEPHGLRGRDCSRGSGLDEADRKQTLQRISRPARVDVVDRHAPPARRRRRASPTSACSIDRRGAALRRASQKETASSSLRLSTSTSSVPVRDPDPAHAAERRCSALRGISTLSTTPPVGRRDVETKVAFRDLTTSSSTALHRELAPRRPGLRVAPQPHRRTRASLREDGAASLASRARKRRHRPRPDDRSARWTSTVRGFVRWRFRRPGVHHDRRERSRHPARQHDPDRPGPSCFGLAELHQLRGRVGPERPTRPTATS